MRKSQDGFSVIELLLVLVIVVAIGGVGYFVYHKHSKNDNVASSSTNVFPPITVSQFGNYGNLPSDPKPAYPNSPRKVGNLVDKNEYQIVVVINGSKTSTIVGKLSDSSTLGTWNMSDAYSIDLGTKLNTISIRSTAVVEWTNAPSWQPLVRDALGQTTIATCNPTPAYSCQPSAPSKTSSTSSGNSGSSGTNSAVTWNYVTFSPENLKLSFPSNLSLKQPTELTASAFDSSVKAYASSISNGFSIQLAIFPNPSTFSGYTNQEPATQEGSFNADGKQFYLVLNNEDSYLMVSTCSNKVCPYSAHSAANSGVLVFANYSVNNNPLPMNDSYIPTVEKILESLSY